MIIYTQLLIKWLQVSKYMGRIISLMMLSTSRYREGYNPWKRSHFQKRILCPSSSHSVEYLSHIIHWGKHIMAAISLMTLPKHFIEWKIMTFWLISPKLVPKYLVSNKSAFIQTTTLVGDSMQIWLSLWCMDQFNLLDGYYRTRFCNPRITHIRFCLTSATFFIEFDIEASKFAVL